MVGRIVVTGAGGFVGSSMLETLSHVPRRTTNEHREVVGIDLPTSTLKPGHGYGIVYHDITNPDLADLLKPGDRVLHLAAVATMAEADQNPLKALWVNVAGTFNVVRACHEAGVERLVFSSTGSVLSLKAEVPFKEDAPVDPPNFYGWTKAKCEEIIQRYCKTKWVILRYGYIYGPSKLHGAIGSFIKNLREDKAATIYGGKQTNDFTAIWDICYANHLALETSHINQIYHIGSGRANSILDVYDACCNALNKKIPANIMPERPGDYSVFLYDIRKAEKLLQYIPSWTLFDGVKQMVKMLEAQQPPSESV